MNNGRATPRIALTRRDVIAMGAALGIAPVIGAGQEDKMLARPIPQSDETLPVIGLGTWQVFDIDDDPALLAQRREIVDLLVAKGGSVIDSSPMYASSEGIVGKVIEASGNRDDLFLATKVWTNGEAAGRGQMERSARLMNAQVIDLMQVHNLRDLQSHWPTILEKQNAGLIRYNGITDYRASALGAMEAAMRRYEPQFIQINYSLGEREAADRLLPFAMDSGVAVMINRPFVSGALFRAVRGVELPDWASNFADSWGQFFLKYIVSHPAVTVVIPATSKPHHMLDNLGAGFGELPDARTRRRMEAFIDAL